GAPASGEHARAIVGRALELLYGALEADLLRALDLGLIDERELGRGFLEQARVDGERRRERRGFLDVEREERERLGGGERHALAFEEGDGEEPLDGLEPGVGELEQAQPPAPSAPRLERARRERADDEADARARARRRPRLFEG